jgi:hypothetical protein
MIDAKKLGKMFRKKEEITLPELITEVDGSEDLTFILKKLIDAGIIVQYMKDGMPYGLTLFGKHLMGVE